MEAIRVYGLEVSYFTGKLEAYLRYKELPYERVGSPPRRREGKGFAQMPLVKLADGRLMTDTTPMIAWLETQAPDPPVIPHDPLQAFVSRLLEDHADEWLWRPAMHYRWSYPGDRNLLRRKIDDGMQMKVPLPRVLRRQLISTRQRVLYVWTDGVSRTTWDHVESIYHDSLRQLQAIFRERPFLLGDVPTLADFGYMGPMFRHFGQDPTASTLMRETAPEVYEWVARVWNARASRTRGALLPGIPDDWSPILDMIGRQHLPCLAANAEAWKQGRRRLDVEIEGVVYRRLRTSRYRVWCLEELRRHYRELPDEAAARARALLEKHGCWEPLWRVEEPASGVDPDGAAPFAPGLSMIGL
jgi:glutathione S-transferase